MPVVIDTNAFIAALKGAPGAANRQVIRLCLQRRLEPAMGTTLFTEYESVLSRRGLFIDCLLDAGERAELLVSFLSVSRWVSVYFLWLPNLPDEADNHLVDLAAAAASTIIISNNVRDFDGEQMRFLNINAVTLGDFMANWEMD